MAVNAKRFTSIYLITRINLILFISVGCVCRSASKFAIVVNRLLGTEEGRKGKEMKERKRRGRKEEGRKRGKDEGRKERIKKESKKESRRRAFLGKPSFPQT